MVGGLSLSCVPQIPICLTWKRGTKEKGKRDRSTSPFPSFKYKQIGNVGLVIPLFPIDPPFGVLSLTFVRSSGNSGSMIDM